jgi:hypothetical protein
MDIRRCLATKILVEVKRLYGSFRDAWRVSRNRYGVALAAFMIRHSYYLHLFPAVLMLFWPRSRFVDSQALWADSLTVEGNRGHLFVCQMH